MKIREIKHFQLMTAKTDLIQRLKKQGAFWSYAKEGIENLPDRILIEEALRMGDVEEIQQLFRIYPIEQIKQVWHEKLIPDQRIYPHNYYLALIFFDIENPREYIKPLQKKYSRYERLKNVNT